MDTIANCLSKIKNAVRAEKREVVLKNSKIVEAIVKVLKEERFIDNFEMTDEGIVVSLLFDGKKSVITDVKRISKGGLRVYVDAKNLKPVLSGRGIGIISTSKGVMTVENAKKQNIGGEYLCQIW